MAVHRSFIATALVCALLAACGGGGMPDTGNPNPGESTPAGTSGTPSAPSSGSSSASGGSTSTTPDGPITIAAQPARVTTTTGGHAVFTVTASAKAALSHQVLR